MRDGTLTQRVAALRIVANRLGFELHSMRSRGFSVEDHPEGGEWIVTWMNNRAFRVDLVLGKSCGLITRQAENLSGSQG